MTDACIDECRVDEWRCTPALEPATFRSIWRNMALDGFKWDGQVGDTTTLAPFAIILPQFVWRGLAQRAEALAIELIAAETELAGRPELWRHLGIPRQICEALSGNDLWTPAAARVIRFDFHPTAQGWRVSEANSDVPGGYAEASAFTQHMAAFADGAQLSGDPAASLCEALVMQAQQHGRVALLAAPGYVEDIQVIAGLSAALRARGVATRCLRPEQLQWRSGVAHVPSATATEPVDAVFRFYQGEWMTRVSGDGWRQLFRGGRTPVCNPAAAVFGESKRLLAIASELETAMPTWRKHVPDTQRARAAWTNPRGDWVLKRSYSNTGDAVISRRWARPAEYGWALVQGLVTPTEWTAQRCFETLRIATPSGLMRPCLGVYVVNRRACGIYCRLSPHPIVDFRAIDTAVLVEST